MKTILQLLLFLFLFKGTNAQIELIKNNKVFKCTVYRERFYPDTIKKELYEYVVFNKAGNIIEQYKPYNNFQTPIEKYFYDSLERLIKYTGFNKKGEVYESWEWKTLADSNDRKKFTPGPWSPNEYSWIESFNSWIWLGNEKRAKTKIKIDTIPFSKKGINKLIRIVALRDIRVDTVNFYFGKNIRMQEQISHFNNAKINIYTIKFDSEGRMTEQYPVNRLDGQLSRHFIYKYNKNGLIKEVISKYGDNKISEREDYMYEYYKD